MITLYHCKSARSFRALWALEETGLDYELKMLPFPPRAKAREYLDVNPLGTVPTLFDGNLRMTESAAMCHYLAAKDPAGTIHVQESDPQFGDYLNWLHHGEATLTFPQTLVLRYGQLEPPERRLPQAAEDYRKWFLARLRLMEPVIAQQPYLLGERFTAADISVAYALFLAKNLGIDGEFSEAVQTYAERTQARPAFQRSLETEQEQARAQGVA